MISIDENLEHFAKGYRRAVVKDKYGDELTINVTPYGEAFVSIGDEKTVAVEHEDLEKLAAFFAQFI